MAYIDVTLHGKKQTKRSRTSHSVLKHHLATCFLCPAPFYYDEVFLGGEAVGSLVLHVGKHLAIDLGQECLQLVVATKVEARTPFH